MPSAFNLRPELPHPEFEYLCPSPSLRRKARFACAFAVVGSIAAASGLVVQEADRGPDTDGRSAVAAAPLGLSATPAANSALLTTRANLLCVIKCSPCPE